jgi:hypothetical protein
MKVANNTAFKFQAKESKKRLLREDVCVCVVNAQRRCLCVDVAIRLDGQIDGATMRLHPNDKQSERGHE